MGNIIWSRGYFSGPDDEGWAICVDSARNVYVAGFTTDAAFDKNFLVLKYDSAGTLCWTWSVGGTENDELHGAAIGPDGNLVVSGFSYSSAVPYYRIIKFNTAPQVDTGAVADDGKLLIAPNSLDLTSPASEAVFRVAGKPGQEAELRVYDSAGRLAGMARVALDAEGHGRISYGRDGWGGKRPVPGAYWVVASGGGVKGKKLFFVLAGRK